MSYTALYRKYRPNTFDKIVGQQHIVKTLKNQILSGRVSHAYLFCGTRGTGKTSTAKIFARAINCLEKEGAEPCNHCALCKTMNEGHSMNVIEIDAASNNGVDNIREIREEVKYPPTEGTYKVYIIDEVHMLSTGAFNALLKTLEEPPAHVIFILATTDPQKVPATILSRCQRFDFRRISVEEIASALKEYLAEEKVEIEEKALYYIAHLADGSMRDCLSITDQCIAFYYGQKITFENVLDIMGSVDNKVFFEMTESICKKDIVKAMELLNQIILQGRDMIQFVTDWIVHFRNLLLVKTVENSFSILDISNEQLEKLKLQAQILTSEQLLYFIQLFSNLLSELKYASNQRILLEVVLIKLCSDYVEQSYESIAARISDLEKNIQQGNFAVSFNQSNKQKEEKKIQKPKVRKPKAQSEDIKQVIEVWEQIKKEATGSMIGVTSVISLGKMENENLYLICDSPAAELLAQTHMEQVQELLEKKIGKAFELKVIQKEDYEKWYHNRYGSLKEESDEGFEKVVEYFSDAEIYE